VHSSSQASSSDLFSPVPAVKAADQQGTDNIQALLSMSITICNDLKDLAPRCTTGVKAFDTSAAPLLFTYMAIPPVTIRKTNLARIHNLNEVFDPSVCSMACHLQQSDRVCMHKMKHWIILPAAVHSVCGTTTDCHSLCGSYLPMVMTFAHH
jgi:hypothetical protein